MAAASLAQASPPKQAQTFLGGAENRNAPVELTGASADFIDQE
jgi:hypothetical protein